ncbi:Hypothetical predicted protein [Marmota monax]|uniref:Uncharacterized protein n=1 Tax=Marmota monax TaxID=9995 RepID=A0A5E4A4B5_MARMO|nr:hypothetical protein GHT09_010322 [Marmota monax]VTJ51562.1 Hypothetical predicted protein [Marmota monax]
MRPVALTYLPPPWGECRSSEMGLDFFPVYSITACRIDCETRYIVENCNCRMVHMPGDAPFCTPEQHKECAEPALACWAFAVRVTLLDPQPEHRERGRTHKGTAAPKRALLFMLPFYHPGKWILIKTSREQCRQCVLKCIQQLSLRELSGDRAGRALTSRWFQKN